MPVPSFSNVAVGDKITAANWNQFVVASQQFLLGPPECIATNSDGTSVPDSTYLVIPFTSETCDTGVSWDGAMHDNITLNTRIKITTAGRYDIEGRCAWAATANGSRRIHIRRNAGGNYSNGTMVDAFVWGSTPSTADVGCFEFMRATATFAVGEYIEMFLYQTSGSALVLNASFPTWMRARLVGS